MRVQISPRAPLKATSHADARVDVKKMVRGYLDSLGLSVAGMNRNRWKIAPAVEEPAETAQQPVRRPSARDRLKVVPSGEGA